MMERRLKLARRLLNPDDSVLIVTIDEKELHHLGLLLEQTFKGMKIQLISSLINPQGISSGAGEFSKVSEYLLFVYVGDATLTKWSRSMVDNDKEASDVSDDRTVRWADFARYGNNAGRQHSPGAFYPIFVDEMTEAIHSVGDALNWSDDPTQVTAPAGTRAVWPPKRPDGGDGRWRVVATSCRELAELGYLRVGTYNKRSGRHSISYLQGGTIELIRSGEIVVTGTDSKGAVTVEYASNTKTATPKTIWTLASHDASRHGSNLLRSLLPGRSFPFPKSLYAVEDALRFFVKTKPRAVVLDFFAGSGTTAHAVMRLNRQDHGRRQCILVTNNEVGASEQVAMRAEGYEPGDAEWERHGICEDITKPRVTAAITGVTPDGESVRGSYKFIDEFPMSDGFEENAEFFNLTYEDPDLVGLGRRFEALAPLLWLKAGGSGTMIEKQVATWCLPDDANYGILFAADQWRSFIDALVARDRPVSHVYIVTDSDAVFQQILSELPTGVQAAKLYDDYLRTFELNTKGRA